MVTNQEHKKIGRSPLEMCTNRAKYLWALEGGGGGRQGSNFRAQCLCALGEVGGGAIKLRYRKKNTLMIHGH